MLLGGVTRIVIRGDLEPEPVRLLALIGLERAEELVLDALRELPELGGELVATLIQ